MYMDFGPWGHDTGEDRIPGNTEELSKWKRSGIAGVENELVSD